MKIYLVELDYNNKITYKTILGLENLINSFNPSSMNMIQAPTLLPSHKTILDC
jgi:hypothetical protein